MIIIKYLKQLENSKINFGSLRRKKEFFIQIILVFRANSVFQRLDMINLQNLSTEFKTSSQCSPTKHHTLKLESPMVILVSMSNCLLAISLLRPTIQSNKGIGSKCMHIRQV